LLLFIAVLVLTVAVIFPFIRPIITSAILAYIFYPVYKWFNKKIKKKNISALIVSALIILLLMIPLSFMLYNLGKEANVGYVLIKQKLSTSGIYEKRCEEGAFCGVLNYIRQFTSRPEA
jgi:predicted PurR-regulated permease PerM